MSKCPRCKKRKSKVSKVTDLDGKPGTIREIFCDQCAKVILVMQRKAARADKKKEMEVIINRVGIPYRDTDKRANPLLTKIGDTNGNGIFLYGSTGTMKTRSLCVLATRAAKRGHTCVWINCSPMLRRFSSALMDGTADGMLDAYIRPDILVIDDWGKGKVTDRGCEFLYDVTNLRFERGRPIWYTSNNGPEWVKKWIKEDDANYCPAIERRIVQGCMVVNTGETK